MALTPLIALLTNIGFPSRPPYYLFTISSAGLVEGMGNLSLKPTLPPNLHPYPLPSPSLCFALDEGLPLPLLHPSLPFPVTTPPSTQTPPLTLPTHSMSKLEHSKQCKDQRDLCGLTKKGQHCRPSSASTRAKRESMSLFWKLERELGLQETLECSQKVVDSGREEMEHDMMSCRDCLVHGDIVYCEQSKYHPNHPYHCCSPWQNCYYLALEYSSDLSCHPDLNVS